MPSKTELVARYREFMTQVNASLPEGMSDADREVAIKKALDDQLEKDLGAVAEAAEEDLQDIYHAALLEEEQVHKETLHKDQMAAIKAGI